MALQSSGQIKLSEIAAEFGGSAPHALSEYYGDGNAPSSGEIQLAADFYGTSNNISWSATLSFNGNEQKSGNSILGFYLSSSRFSSTSLAGGTSPSSLGSVNTQLSGNNIKAVFRDCMSIAADRLRLEFTNAVTNWNILTIGSTNFSRTSASTSDNKLFEWINAGNNVDTYMDDCNGAFKYHYDPFSSSLSPSNTLSTGTVSVSIS